MKYYFTFSKEAKIRRLAKTIIGKSVEPPLHLHTAGGVHICTSTLEYHWALSSKVDGMHIL